MVSEAPTGFRRRRCGHITALRLQPSVYSLVPYASSLAPYASSMPAYASSLQACASQVRPHDGFHAELLLVHYIVHYIVHHIVHYNKLTGHGLRAGSRYAVGGSSRRFITKLITKDACCGRTVRAFVRRLLGVC